MFVKEVQPPNALYPILIVLSGMIKLVMPEQFQNALPPIFVTFSGMIIPFNAVQL